MSSWMKFLPAQRHQKDMVTLTLTEQAIHRILSDDRWV